MFTQLLTLVSALAVVRAVPNPQTPEGVQKVGGDCTVTWTPDATGVWKKMHIELMAGANLAMEHLTTVATVDGTDPNNNTFTFTCPGVTPNSAVFFYQFTSPFAPLSDTTWTTRFAIADASGNTVPPANATQPNGQAIPWGTAELTDPSTAVAAPTDAGTQVSGNASASGSGTASGSTGSTDAAGSSSAGASAAGGPTSASAPAASVTPPTGASGTPAPASGSSTKVAAGGSGSKSVSGSSSGSSSAAAAASTNGAISVRGAPLYALGAVAAFVAYAL